MKNIIPIFLMYLPLVLLAQNSLEKSRLEDRAKWEGVQERIEDAVERGEITREQADERYAGFKRRMKLRDIKGENNDKSSVEDKALWEGFQRRIEIAVERGEITREQADEHYVEFRRRMGQRNDDRGRMNLNRREQNTELAAHFKKLGISDLNRIKNGLLDNGITDSQLDAVLGGMVRLIHGSKADGKDFEMNPRLQVYFQDRIGLNQEQVLYVMDVSVRIAQRVR